MGMLNSALQIGRSAILSYQGALQVIGNNISSAGSPDYTRLLPQLDPLQGTVLGRDLQPGAGVALTGIQRNIDEALESRVRLAIGAQEAAEAEQATLAGVEAFFYEVGGADVPTRLLDFFGSFDELQNRPEDTAVRDLAVQSGVLLAESLQAARGRIASLAADADGQIADLVDDASDVAQRIAELNGHITTTEAGRDGQATSLRDQRDALLRELSQFFSVTVREQPDGALNVYVGNEALVQGRSVRRLIAVEVANAEATRTTIRFADTNQQTDVRGGRRAALVGEGAEYLYGLIAAFDELASALIAEVNRIHADGQGLIGFTAVEGTNEVLRTDVPLETNAAGLSQPPRSGSFFISMADDVTRTPVSYRINVNLEEPDPTTLESLVADVNARVTGLTASITSDNRIAFNADEGFTFTFGYDGEEAREDTARVLAALGVNTFFTGSGAGDIAVNDAVVDDPRLLAGASVFVPGDGTTARRIAESASTAVEKLAGASITDFYNSIASSVAVAGAAAKDAAEAASSIMSSLLTQKESVSGVNLDEEAISLVKYERAFQGASRFISVVDDLLQELVLLVR